jgi:glycosyltransferase involved in cell wall biosynthesis
MNRIPAPLAAATLKAIAAAHGLLRAGRFDEADRVSLDILATDPANADAHLVHGSACLRRGMLEETERSVEKVFALDPGHPGARLLRAEVMRARGRDAEALAETARALARIFPVPDTPPETMRGLLDVVATAHPTQWQAYFPVFEIFGALLARSGANAAPGTFDGIEASPIATCPDEEFAARFSGAAALLGFSRAAPVQWNRAVLETVLAPWMRRALASDRLEPAFEIERNVYEIHVKQLEDEAHFARCVSQWRDAMREAGARFASSLPRVARGAPGALPRIAFFLHNVTRLAHAQMVVDLIEGNAGLADPRFEPYVFCLTGERETIERLRRAGARVEVLYESSFRPGLRSALSILRRRIAEAAIDELVWVSLVVLMPFAFGMRLAPAQTWWALKYHNLELPEIDGYLTGGGTEGGTKTIHGRTWLAGPVASGEWTAPGKAGQAADIRRSLGAAGIVFGCFGREEKLNSEAFLDAVARVLTAIPDAIFLWTGREQLPQIQQRLEAAGVASRCRFIGWVDTKLYAQVIDVFLDSFPFPCGFTLYEAAAAGRPAVLFSSAASADTGANALIGPLLDEGDPEREAARLARSIFHAHGENLCLRAFTVDEYVALAVRAGTDPQFRRNAGDAYRAFVERFLADRSRAARIYGDHLLAVLEAAGRRAAA